MRHIVMALFLLSMVGMAQESYYPYREGLSWTYSTGETQTFAAETSVDGQTVQVLTHYLEGSAISEDYLIYDDSGVRTLGTAAGGQTLDYDPFLTIYPPAPIQVGQSWKSEAQVSGFDISISSEVVAVRGVQTAAGRFNALQIRQQTVTSTGGQTIMDLFFVPSIGVVQWVLADGTTVDLIEKNF